MLDKKKIRLMTKMAMYDQSQAAKDLKISSYYKKDYSSLNTWFTILWVTIGYVMVAGLIVLCNMDALLADLSLNKLLWLVALAVGAYFALLIVYAVGASMFYKTRHNESKQRVKGYYRDLARLEKISVKEK